jgi:hypothetical protein
MYKSFSKALVTIKSQGLSGNFWLVFNMRNQSYKYQYLATHMYIKTYISEGNVTGFLNLIQLSMFCTYDFFCRWPKAETSCDCVNE